LAGFVFLGGRQPQAIQIRRSKPQFNSAALGIFCAPNQNTGPAKASAFFSMRPRPVGREHHGAGAAQSAND
jgi:hypothetical protein